MPCRDSLHAPLCIDHIRADLKLDIRPSKIPGAGRGLFTLVDRAVGDHLVDYVGELIDAAESERRYPGTALGPYALRLSKSNTIDAALLRGVGAYINASRRSVRPNVSFTPHPNGRSARFTAKKFIAAGSELTVSYGREYWYDRKATHSTDEDPSEWAASVDTSSSSSLTSV